MKTAVYLVAGFLGAGKTSTLRHILAATADFSETMGENPTLPGANEDGRGAIEPAPTVVVVNEAGALGLDGQLVERYGLPVYELRGGCICCTSQVDFLILLDKLFKANPPRQIIMEASGLADAGKLVEAISRFKPHLEFCKTVLLLEAAMWEAKEVLGEFFFSQLPLADLVLFNKVDQYPPAQIESFINEIRVLYPFLEVAPVTFGQVEPQVFFAPPADNGPDSGAEGFLPGRAGQDLGIPPLESAGPNLAAALAAYETFSLELDAVWSARKWTKFLAQHGHNFERIKGQIKFEDGPVYLDYVRGEASLQEPLPGLDKTCLIFIGKNIDRDQLLAQLNELGQIIFADTTKEHLN